MLNICDIAIDPEFEALIPRLSDDERTQLVANIERDGFRDPLVVWRNHSVLLDGHNRLRIWQERFQGDENREPEIIELKFATREDAMAWIITNQLGRRNLPDAVRVQLAMKLKPMIETRAKNNQQAAGGAVSKKSSEPVRTMAEVAKVAGVSEPTARQVEKVLASGDEAVKADMLVGKTSINAAYKTTTAKSPPPSEQADIESLGVGVRYGNDAIDCLKRIPKNDGLRKRGFQLVTDWIRRNYGEALAGLK